MPGLKERIAVLLEWEGVSKFVSESERVGNAGDKNVGKVDDRLNKLGGRMQMAGAGMIAFAAIGIRALSGLAAQSEDAEAQERKLDLALDHSPKLAASKQAFLDLAASLQKTTVADGDAVVGLEGLLLTLGRSKDEVLELTPLIVDLATRTGMSFDQAGKLVNNALNGQTTRLEKWIGQMQGGESVADALRRTVGGFAEGEAQTFSGRIEQMKNKLGDLAEGIGSGAVDAFSSWISAGDSALDMLGGLSEGTQAGIGTFAAYASAAAGVVGGVSFLAGSLVKLRERFTNLNVESGTRSLNAFGAVATGLSIATLAIGLYEMGKAMTATTTDVDALNRSLEDNEVLAAGRFVNAANFTNKWDELVDQILGKSVPAMERLYDAMVDNQEALGVTDQQLAHVRQKIDEKREADVQGAVDQQNYNEAVNEGADASEGLANSTQELAQKHQQAASKARDQASAIRGVIDALKAAHDETVKGQDLIADWEGSLDDLTQSLHDNGRTLDLNSEQGRNNYQAARDTSDALVALVQRRYEETGSMVEAINAGDAYVEQLKTQLRQAGLTDAQVQTYIDTLHLVPGQIATSIKLDNAQAVAALQEVQRALAGVQEGGYEYTLAPKNRPTTPSGLPTQRPVGHRAKGGPVKKNLDYLVGEKGPELFVPTEDGFIVPDINSRASIDGSVPGTAVGQAAIAGVDPEQWADKLDHITDVYLRLAKAAGKAAADEALWSSQSVDAFEAAADAAETNLERTKNAYDDGAVPAEQYLGLLNEQLTGVAQYSDEYESIVGEIKRVQDKQLKDQRDQQARMRELGQIGNAEWVQILQDRVAATKQGSQDQIDALKDWVSELEDQARAMSDAEAPWRSQAENQIRDLTQIYKDAVREQDRQREAGGDVEDLDTILARMQAERQRQLSIDAAAAQWAGNKTGFDTTHPVPTVAPYVDPAQAQASAELWGRLAAQSLPAPNELTDAVRQGMKDGARDWAKVLLQQQRAR